MPKLRFPGFEGEWSVYRLSDFTTRITRKNTGNESSLPLTISSKDRLVDQVTYFNKTVASKDMSGYYLLKNGEYAYNKSYSVGYDFGSIKRLDRYEMGALSTLYICFALTKHDSDFIKTYFDSLKWYKEIYMIAAEGARNHGLLNVPTDDFFATQHILPNNEQEQHKIAQFLGLLETRIEKQRQLVDALKSYKRGLINSIIDGNIHPHKEHSPWINMTVGEAFVITRGNVLPISETRSRKSSTFCYPVYSSQTKDDGLMGFYSEYLYENCITWTTDGANAGCVKYRAGKFYCTNVCGVLLEKAKQPDYFIAEVINRISKKYVSYVGNPKLMNNVMAEISIDIPSSDESRFLSNVVKVIINRIKSEEDVLTKLETYKSGLLQTIFI